MNILIRVSDKDNIQLLDFLIEIYNWFNLMIFPTFNPIYCVSHQISYYFPTMHGKRTPNELKQHYAIRYSVESEGTLIMPHALFYLGSSCSSARISIPPLG